MHGYPDSKFWSTWADGAVNAIPPCTTELIFLTMGYQVDKTVQEIQAACQDARTDAIIVTVPYEDPEDVTKMINAINSCAKSSLTFYLTNTDEAWKYGSDNYAPSEYEPIPKVANDWSGYAGSFNYEMGEVCGRFILSNDLDSALEGKSSTSTANAMSFRTTSPLRLTQIPIYQIYLLAREVNNTGIVMRSKGIVDAMGTNRICGPSDEPVTTTGGTADEESLCTFPFEYKGITYSECTKVDNGNIAWCSLDTEYDFRWGNCVCDGSTVGVVSSQNELDTSNFIIALGVDAAQALIDQGISPSFQCGDDQDRTTLPFYGQTPYTQGAAAAMQQYATIIKEEYIPSGLATSASGNGVCAAEAETEPCDFLTHPYTPASCPLRLTTITHAYEDSPFWSRWREASTTAAQDFTHTYVATAYDVSRHVAAIKEACEKQDPSEDAIVVTVPYPKGEGYEEVDQAINDCLNLRPTLPIVTTNTDSYHNPRVLSYVGSENYAIGEVCGRAVFTDDPAVMQGSRPLVLSSSVMTRRAVVYQRQEELLNEGINNRYRAINKTVFDAKAVYGVLRFTTPSDVASYISGLQVGDRDAVIMVLGYDAVVDMRASGVRVDFACGDDMDDTIPHYGQHVWSQGVGSSGQAITAARAEWPVLIGNAQQYQDPKSLKPIAFRPFTPPLPPPPSPPPFPPPALPPPSPPSPSPPPPMIEGYVFENKDSDQLFTEGLDEYLEGVTVFITNGQVTYTVVTDANGFYSQELPSAGEWTVVIDKRSFALLNMRQTLGAESTIVDVPPGGVGRDLDGFTQPSSLSGTIFMDAGVIGYYDPDIDDEGLEGVTVIITKGDVTYTVTTNADGNYAQELLPGEWTVTIDTSTLPPGLVQTMGETPTVVSVPYGGVGTDLDGFTLFDPPSPPPFPPPAAPPPTAPCGEHVSQIEELRVELTRIVQERDLAMAAATTCQREVGVLRIQLQQLQLENFYRVFPTLAPPPPA